MSYAPESEMGDPYGGQEAQPQQQQQQQALPPPQPKKREKDKCLLLCCAMLCPPIAVCMQDDDHCCTAKVWCNILCAVTLPYIGGVIHACVVICTEEGSEPNNVKAQQREYYKQKNY